MKASHARAERARALRIGIGRRIGDWEATQPDAAPNKNPLRDRVSERIVTIDTREAVAVHTSDQIRDAMIGLIACGGEAPDHIVINPLDYMTLSGYPSISKAVAAGTFVWPMLKGCDAPDWLMMLLLQERVGHDER